MAEFLKKTVKPSGGNYTSLEACMNANEQDLTGDGWFTVEIDGTWSSADTSAVTIHNYTTTASDYINIYTTAAARHDGKGSLDTDKYRIVNGTAFAAAINIGDNYVTITGLQITTYTGFAYGEVGLNIGQNQTGILIDKCFCHVKYDSNDKGGSTIAMAYAGTVEVRNTIAVQTGTGNAISAYSTEGTKNINNCIAIAYGSNAILTNADYGTLTIRNTYASSGTTTAFSTVDATLTTCASDDGSQSTATVAYDTSTFTNVTAGSEDFHLVAGSSLINAGTDLSATFTDDIDGTTRPTGAGTWDIGADEYASSTYVYTRGDYADLPTDDSDLETAFTEANYTTVSTDDTNRVDQTATNLYAIFKFKDKNTNSTDLMTVTWNGQSTTAPSASIVKLQIYDRTQAQWEDLDSDNTTGANTDFDLTADITTELDHYYDASSWISCRVWQDDL